MTLLFQHFAGRYDDLDPAGWTEHRHNPHYLAHPDLGDRQIMRSQVPGQAAGGFHPVGAPEGQHAYFRGLYLGQENTHRYIPDPTGKTLGTQEPYTRSLEPHDVLDKMVEHVQRRRDQDLVAGPEHPRSVPFGSRWTTEPHLAHKFAFDPLHGHYRDPRWSRRGPVHAAIIEVHTPQEPKHSSWNEFENEVDPPLRTGVTRAFLHLHRVDMSGPGHEHCQPSQHPTHVSTTEIPMSVVKTAMSSADHWTTCDQGHAHWGGAGAAGVLLRHTDDEGNRHYLLQHRSPWVQEGDTWSIPGGALHPGEEPQAGALREAREEMGKIPEGTTHAFTHTDDHGGWAYHTVVLDSPEKFTAGTSDEVGEHGSTWVPEHQVDSLPLHSGFAKTWPQIRKHAKTAAAPGAPADPHKVFEHKRLLAEHLADQHPELAGSPPAMYDALHRAAHTSEGRGWGAQQRGQQGFEMHEHHPLIDPTVSKSIRLSKDAAHSRDKYAFDPDAPDHERTYLRFGDWSEDERSHNHITGHKEFGVSTYDLGHDGDPLDPDPHMEREHEHEDHCEPDCDLDRWNDEVGNDPGEEMRDRARTARVTHNSERYSRANLVKGTFVGIGHDGEPLLQNLRRVGHWPCDIEKHIPGAHAGGIVGTDRGWCGHTDHEDEDEHHTASKDVDDIMDALGPNVPKTPVQPWETDEERAQRIKEHKERQAARPGLNPGDDISQHQMGKEYPTAEWVPIEVAQKFRDHTGDQWHGSQGTVDDLTGQLKSGRGVTDPLMLLHHNEARVAHLGEGNHRLVAMENAGWSHVPMRVVRMYDSEATDKYADKHIPRSWTGSHTGRTPEMAQPSEVFSFGSKQHPAYPDGHGREEGGTAGPGLDQSLGRRGGPLALLRWVGAGKSRRRDRQSGQSGQGQPGAQGPQQPDAAPVDPRPVTWHPKAAKEFKSIHPQDRKQILARIEQLRVNDPLAVAQSHPLLNDMKGWTSTKASRGHRIVHQDRDGTMHIVYAGLHYESVDMPSRKSVLAGLEWVPDRTG